MEGLEDISPTAGLEDITIQPFVGIANMRRIIKCQSEKLQKGNSDQQYLVFARVSVDDLAKIDRALDSIGMHTRMTHYTDIDLLIVKLPSAEHEAAPLNLTIGVVEKLVMMGMPANEFHAVGATRIRGRNSSKEADSAYRPYSFRPNKTDWPTIVFEAGLSESLSRLRSDARWWLMESGGDVKTVIIISVKRAQSMIRIEKWELAPRTGRRLTLRSATNPLNHLPTQIPTKIHEITIVQNTVTGAPLILEFQKIFLRPAVLPESDITFTAQELSTWAARIW
jgi:hypothetical protein